MKRIKRGNITVGKGNTQIAIGYVCGEYGIRGSERIYLSRSKNNRQSRKKEIEAR